MEMEDNILAPKLHWIGGRCYRINPTNPAQYSEADADVAGGDVDGGESLVESSLGQYIEKDLFDEDDAEDDSFDIKLLDTELFKSTFHVPKVFYGMLIGARGATRKRLETETKTQLKVPQSGADGDVELLGATRGSVASARRRIEQIIIAARAKRSPTHMVCVPVVHASIKERFEQFKAAILAGPPIFGLEESLFMNVDKMHVTFGVLSLMDSVDLELAKKLLADCQQTIVKPILQSHGTLDFRVSGLASMNDDPSEVHVLYGRVECEALQLIADQIVAVFVKNGLMQREREHVKLHATVVNSKYRVATSQKSKEAELTGGTERRQPFDGRRILEDFGDWDFGKQPVSEIHLARLKTVDCSTGFYASSSVLKVL